MIRCPRCYSDDVKVCRTFLAGMPIGYLKQCNKCKYIFSTGV